LAWATEAFEKAIISEKETLVPLQFGDYHHYRQALHQLGKGGNDFYRLLGQGVKKATARFGGNDFACVLGQEMAGYATGEVFFASQALGFRHSHLDAGGYALDQEDGPKDVDKAVDFLVSDEQARVGLTIMVACLFARNVYRPELLAECLKSVGYEALADTMNSVSRYIQKKRWQIRMATGYDPLTISIPKRFSEVSTWKGPIDRQYLEDLQRTYATAIKNIAQSDDDFK
jgi:aldehyde:ferredoxin oxidoreductase